MISPRTYLDHNATSPLRPAARAAMCAALDAPGNASSVHAEGRGARACVEQAREDVAALVGAQAADIIFTSGGTEAANTLLAGGLSFHGSAPERLLVLATEHPCVLEGHGFGERARPVPVTGDGVVDLDWLRLDLARNGPALVALQYVNSETGVIQPVQETAALVHAAGGVLVCDAAQAAGKLVIDMAALGADALFISAHKIGGPQGAGAIALGGGFVALQTRLLRGGGQERGARAGTENVAVAATFSVPARAAADVEALAARCRRLQQLAEQRLRAILPEATVFGAGVARAPNVTAFAAHGFSAQTLLMLLDLQGIAVSSGSACSSGKVRRSHVLEAMGVDAGLANGAIRISTGWNSEEKDIHRMMEVLAAAVARKQGPGAIGGLAASRDAISA